MYSFGCLHVFSCLRACLIACPSDRACVCVREFVSGGLFACELVCVCVRLFVCLFECVFVYFVLGYLCACVSV